MEFKYFKSIAKMILYFILGGLLAFIIVFISTFMKASAVAGDISRNALLMATQDGCMNNSDYTAFNNNIAESFGTKNLIIPVMGTKNSPDDTGNLQVYRDIVSETWNPLVEGANSEKVDCGLLWIGDSSNKNLINTYGNDYANHVQRGESISVVATVYANIHINFLFGATKPLTFTYPVSASTTGISCKWFKGE